ncbi:DNA helicase [Lotmaria passim]
MNCNCEHPARYLISRDGKPCYTCGLGRCRFFALAPVQCDGYTRIVLGAPGCPPADTGVVLRFEALVHPDKKDVAAFMIHVQGDPQRWDILRREVLQDPQFEGAWYTTAKAFLYPMSHYARLLQAIKARSMPNTALQEIPNFYFRCVERLRQIPLQYAEDVAAGRARRPDPDDCVFRQLKPFQKEGVQFVIAHQGRAMIADDMGLGKTVQAVAVAHHYRDEWPVLVVCPMSLLENWAKEFNKFCGIPYTRIAILQGTKAKATSLQDVVIVSYSSLKCVEEAHFKVVILDESHYIKAGAAKRAQLSLKICAGSRRVLLLSGTPAMSRPIELYAQLQAMHPSIVPSKANFGARYCNSYVSRFGIDMTGHSNSDELHSLLRHYVIRRTKKELGNELPSKSRQLLYVYITEKEKKALEKQVVALRHSLASSTSSGNMNNSAFLGELNGGGGGGGVGIAARTPNAFEMSTATARAKIPAVQDYVSSIVEQHLDSGEKLILFAHHQCMMEALKAAVEAVRPRQPIDYIYISGDTPAAQREPAAEHFRTEPTCTVAILSMQSSGTGHNFTCASTVVFTELDWNPSTHLQCEDRVHRIGQAQPCHIKYLLAEGTSDSVIWPLLQVKLTVTTAMFESTGTATEVHLYDGADKQSVARRDIAAVGGTGGGALAATAVSTPSSSQQSTLDRFMVPPSASQSTKGEDGAPLPAHTTQRASVHSQPEPRQSAPLSAERDSLAAHGLLHTPTSAAQQLADSLMNSPLSAPRGGSVTAAAAAATVPTAPQLVVPFAEMGNALAAEPASRPHQHNAASLDAATTSASSTTATSAAGASPRHGRPSSSHSEALSTAAAATTTSVLDLMRQATSKSPAKTTGTSSAPVVVDLTETGSPIVAQPAPLLRAGPLTQQRSFPVSSTFLPLASTSASTPVAPRRTVFTFGATTSTATTGNSTPVARVSPLPTALSPPATARAGSPPVATVPPSTVLSKPTPVNSLNNSSVAGAVHIPLRPNLHFKRPRNYGDDAGGSTNAGSAAPPPVSSTPALATVPSPVSSPAFGNAAAAQLTPFLQPVTTFNPAVSSPVPCSVVGLAASATASAVPRRTLFKLVSNTGPEQSHKKV